MVAQASVGYYGKIPGKGDFISRRVSREFTDFWDAWLQNGLSCSHTQLNEAWLNVYLTSPIWRFILSPGMCGRQLWIGVVMPSVDKVGRYFPLTIVTPLAEDLNPFNVAKLALDWFKKAEAIALSTLEEQSFDFETFDKQVEESFADLPNFAEQGMSIKGGLVNFRTSKGWRFPVTDASSVDKSYSSLLWQLTNNRFSTYSLWWCDGSEHIEPSMLVADGLPSVESYAAMLDGKWQKWSWDDCPVQYLSDKPVKSGIKVVEPDSTLTIPDTLYLNESVVDELDMTNELVVEIQDDWWTEEPDQLAKDAISHLKQNNNDDTPESLVLQAEPAVSEELLAQTMLIDTPDSIDESLQQTQLIMSDDAPELLEKTMLLGNPKELQKTTETQDQATQLIDNIGTVSEPKQGAVLGVLGNAEAPQHLENVDKPKTTDSELSNNPNDSLNAENQGAHDLVTDEAESEEKLNSSTILDEKKAHFNWISSAHTDKGKVRKINEDAFLNLPKFGLWVVADGVGGHKSGAVASQMIVQQLGQIAVPENLESFIENIQSKLQYVNRYLLEKISNSEEYAVGSTVAALLFYGGQAACVWAGDSRIYLNRDGVTTQLTKDHSMSNEQDGANGGDLNQTLEPVNPNIITRAIGADDLLELDIEILDLQKDDAFLLCSDGLYKEVSEEEISEFLNREDSQVISNGLLDLALERNARDNVTVISVMLVDT